MDRLALFLTLMSGSAITGALVITALSLGYYNWLFLLGSAVIGYLMAWPAAKLVSKRIKKRDPGWTQRKTDHILPRPGAREV